MLSRSTNLGIARTAPPCTSGSANDRRHTRVIAMLRQDIGTSRKFQCMHWNVLPIFRRQIPSAIYRRTAPSSRQIFGDVHQGLKYPRHIGDIRRCSCKHRRCIFDIIISPMVSWSIADARRCSRAARLSMGGATAMLLWALEIFLSDWSPMITWALW